MDKDIKVQDLQSYCRTCLAECNGCKYEVKQLPRAILTLFKQVTGFPKTQNELFPKWICDSCCCKMNSFSEFRLMSKKSTQFLLELIIGYNNENLNFDKDKRSGAVEETTVRKSKLPENFLEKKEELAQSSKIPHQISDFENIFLGTEIKDDFEHFGVVQQFLNSTDVLSPTNAANCNEKFMQPVECSVRIEEKDISKGSSNEETLCKVCNSTYSTVDELETHICIQQEKRQFQVKNSNSGFNKKKLENFKINCKYNCGKTFSHIRFASLHYKKKHSSENNSLLDTNAKSCETTDDEKSLSKNTPDWSLETNTEMQTTLPDLNNTTCRICFHNYSSEQKLKIHMRLHLHEYQRPFQCEQCERHFNQKARLKRHIAESHTNDVTEIHCKFGCGKTFRRLETVKKHYYVKHSTTEKQIKPKTYTFICENCGRIFKNVTALREHSYTHRPVEDQPYKCEQCTKSFTSKRSYKDHLIRHAGIKNFECPHCGLKKTTRKELKNHLNIHTKEKVFTCSICAKVFNRMSGLKLHERVVHQGIRLYNCSYCDLSFGKPDTLKHHEMRHTGERPHKCQTCDRSFIQVVALRAHMKTHNK